MGALGLQALLAGKRATYTPRSISSSCGLFSVFLRPGKGLIAEGKVEGLQSWSMDFRVPSLLGRCCDWSTMHREPHQQLQLL